MKYFDNKRRDAMIAGLLKEEKAEATKRHLTALQNEISIAFDTKVLAITSVGEDKLSSAFAKAMGDNYVENNSSACIIDANLYEPCLKELLHDDAAEEKMINAINEKIAVAYFPKEIYPSVVYKAGEVDKLIEEAKKKYEHVLVLVPSVKEHKEVALLKDKIDSALLVSMRSVSKKADIYYALSFFAEAGIPVSRTVILK